MSEDDGVRIDIDGLVSSMERMVPHDVLMPPNCSIFKIPIILSRHNENAFIPDAFSIGPFHHGNQKLKATEKIKARYMHDLISRSRSRDTILRTLISSIAEVEKEAREYYAEPINYSPEKLVEILVIDGCFLIELFCKRTYRDLRKEDDPIFSRPCMFHFLYHDLILLENQVPWMVLERLFNQTNDSSDWNMPRPLATLATTFMRTIYLTYRIDPKSDQCINMRGIKHFVDLSYKLSTLPSTDPQPDQCIIIECIKHLVDQFRKLAALSSTPFRKLANSSSGEEKKKSLRDWELLPSATSLVEAGIKFKRATSGSLLDIKFKDGVLEIPPLVVNDLTETIIRNLISYEQCCPNCGFKFASYVVLLDSLINTVKDINILCDHEIIDNCLNPEDAAQLFNKLYHDTFVAFDYVDLSREVNRFCQRRLPRWRAVLMGKYFNTPWAGFSTLAAIILLIMTFLQTLYAMKK
ncbi:UPF0481 protein At3g47200-like [Corylus avellana]|uniref:UPF0481 protein At3g47200-like n=1 Tax=Corylus avellana TaxID=13451 RepID=UPI001E20E378|nr:UPF0481 protein At3g47200-like [Corylus avellana]